MPANEFEKKVQKIMDEFKLHPSEDVWTKVEKRIQEKKKKRRIIFFILFSFTGLLLAGYGIYHFSNKQSVSQNEITGPEKISNPKNSITETTITPSNKTISNKKPGNEKKKLTDRNQNRIEIRKRKMNASQLNTSLLITRRKNAVATAPANKMNRKPAVNVIADTANSIAGNKNVSSGPQPELLTDTANQKITAGPTAKDVAINNSSDTISIKTSDNKNGEEKNVVEKSKKKDQTTKKLKWGIDFSIGSSDITEDRFSFKTPAYNSADYLFNTPGAPTGPQIRYPRSDSKAAFAFKMGAVVRKNISSRSSVSIGLGYAYLADRIKTGSKSDSTIQLDNSTASFYYRGIPQKTYTDRFHFIELPVIYNWRMTGNPNHFLSLDLGVSASYLLATNALVYDTAFRGIYFHDKSLFTKAHINIMSGISYYFGGGKSFGWSIGPQFSFDVSRLIKTDIDKRRYFLYCGIDARMFFEKKKKK